MKLPFGYWRANHSAELHAARWASATFLLPEFRQPTCKLLKGVAWVHAQSIFCRRRDPRWIFAAPRVLTVVTLADKIEQMKTALTVDEFAEIMNVSNKFVYKVLKRRGGPESYQLGGIIRLDPVSTAQWLRSRTVGKRG